MLWRRYRSTILLAVPAGIALGAVLSLPLYLASNPEYRAQGGWGAFTYVLASGAGVGGVTALAGLLGGMLFLLVADRHLRRPARARVRGGATAAAAGAAILWLTIGLVDALSASGWPGWFPWFAIFAALMAAATGLAATLFLRRAEGPALSSRTDVLVPPPDTAA